jgi:hypothetical protein
LLKVGDDVQGRGIVGLVRKGMFEMIKRTLSPPGTGFGEPKLTMHRGAITGAVYHLTEPADGFVESSLLNQNLPQSKACVPMIGFDPNRFAVMAFGQVETAFLLIRGREGKKTIDGHDWSAPQATRNAMPAGGKAKVQSVLMSGRAG